MHDPRPAPAGRRIRSRAFNLLSAQEEQNKNLARELHDVVSQRLAAVGMEIELLERNPPRSTAQLRDRLRHLGSRITGLAQTMHEISRQLHPAILDDIGLAAALEGECQVLSEIYGNPTSFHAEHLPAEIPDDVALALYRIAQESLRNVARHAPRSAVSVLLSGAGGDITLRIEDAGPGFRRRDCRGKGLGLISMQERARLVRGKLRVQSRPGKGTTIEVRVPAVAARPRSQRARGHAGT